jgi:hypothetical protein
LAEAERVGEQKDPELTRDFLTPGPEKLQFLKEGRAESLVYEVASTTETAAGTLLVNVVLRSSSQGPLAVPMATAIKRSFRPGNFAAIPSDVVARDLAIQSAPTPTTSQPKRNAGSLGRIGESAERLKDALKGVPR